MTQFALARFAPHVGEAFAVSDAPGISWTLAAAEPYGTVVDPATHDRFSLLFDGPCDPVFAQQLVTLAHPVLDTLALFVVPIARDSDGVTYQAVFN